MNRVVLFGGGRWARVLLTALRQLIPAETEIVWVTHHTFQSAKTWLAHNQLSNVKLLQSMELASESVDAVIVATSPESHFALTSQAIRLGLPTLCEKPIANSMHQARQLLKLAESQGCPLGLNLEILFAGYLQTFANQIREVTLHSIHIDWMDPWSLEHFGEVKYAECYTDIVSDQLPHCWSVLATIRPGESKLRISKIRYAPDGVELEGTFGLVPVSIRLNRRSIQRVRQVSINDREWVLDFSQEPGTTNHEKKATVNSWGGLRPLSRSLLEFFQAVKNPGQHQWISSFERTFNATESALLASEQLRTIQDEQIRCLLESSILSSSNRQHVELIVDRFAPQLAENGFRIPVQTTEEQLHFFAYWLSNSNRID